MISSGCLAIFNQLISQDSNSRQRSLGRRPIRNGKDLFDPGVSPAALFAMNNDHWVLANLGGERGL